LGPKKVLDLFKSLPTMNQTAKIAEPDTTADRKKRGRFSLRYSLHISFRQLLCFPGGG
jgi:hypothetical protein